MISPLQQQKQTNLNSWQKNDKRYKVCRKCQGYGIQVTKARREYSRCTQCSGSGWKFIGVASV